MKNIGFLLTLMFWVYCLGAIEQDGELPLPPPLCVLGVTYGVLAIVCFSSFASIELAFPWESENIGNKQCCPMTFNT